MILGLLLVVAVGSKAAFEGKMSTITDELDAAWAEVSRTVAEGDFDAYAATYHEDAILVNGVSGTSYPISSALEGWAQGFTDTKTGKMTAGVVFRFSQRLNDATTAHETGIFHYWSTPTDGETVHNYMHFNALFVKKGGWKMMMEYQKERATVDDWIELE